MRRKRSRSIAAVVLCALVLTSGAWAKTIYVDDDAPPGGDGTSWTTAYRFLRDGLTQAVDGDEVRVGQGEYKPDRRAVWPEGDGDREASFVVPEGVILRGGYAGVAATEPNAWDRDLYETILSGDLAGNDAAIDDPSLFRDDVSREDNSLNVVTVGPAAVLQGVIITGGHAQPWKCTNRNNCPDVVPAPGFYGGGIWIEADNVTVKDCRVHHNFSEMGGGGVYCHEVENLVLMKCVFDHNGAYGPGGGGGLSIDESCAEFADCELSANWARDNGGGLSADTSKVSIVACTIWENRSVYDGGGLYAESGDIQVMDCQINHNTSKRRGGGGCFMDQVEITGCVCAANTSQYGGAISASAGGVILSHCGFYGNTAWGYGGALRTSSLESFVATNCTFAHNRAPVGTFLEAINQSSLQLVVSNCIVNNGGQEIYTYQASVAFEYTAINGYSRYDRELENAVTWGEGNIETDACFVNPGYWDPNGTPDDPNDDYYVMGDYHLKSQSGRWDSVGESWVQDDVTSPCIDAGDPNTPIMYEPFPSGGIINMGAYGGTTEASKSYFGGPVCETIIAGDINGDCKVDIDDLILLIDRWTTE